MPSRVAKEISKFQSNFLWGGVVEDNKRRIHWVSWKNVCLPIECGGLGLKNISDFNMSLLNKWRWRILKGEDSLWFNLLKARYRDIAMNSFCGGKDEVCWRVSGDGIFSVASCYSLIARKRIPCGPFEKFNEVLSLIWKMDIPYKIKAFGWRFFVNRLPFKDLLLVRDIVLSPENLKCVFCGIDPENREHSFLKCKGVEVVWREISSWIGKPWRVIEEECKACFMDWYSVCKKNKVKVNKLGVVWIATMWILWISRNGICFWNEVWDVNNTLWKIKSLLWKWSFFGEITHPISSFYEFNKDPLLFLS
ncbi:uncharacterized protein LOC131634280 [Vicia villosa]|uniref:uncharacterized protein LOC131634280 n=1 Tax=Vicia villosa TaxID=3911 RepID=UPI00273CA277|nr:uncharacterized protein LOC131634280 [Vicia villosa]